MSGREVYLRRHIMVKGRFVDLILSGKKTTTIRLGRVV
ncbi:MAG TPA: ASCH domain-containing protein, partial [Ignisphaera aggregans]|nr:ASCH domain-containing protein [Ignisphaera aggregans]